MIKSISIDFILFFGVVVDLSCFIFFTPIFWEMIQFDEHMFQMG